MRKSAGALDYLDIRFKGNDVLYLSERINDLGIECSHFTCGAGLAFEAWEKGLLGPEQTEGLALEWGNLEAAEALLDGRHWQLIPTRVA